MDNAFNKISASRAIRNAGTDISKNPAYKKWFAELNKLTNGKAFELADYIGDRVPGNAVLQDAFEDKKSPNNFAIELKKEYKSQTSPSTPKEPRLKAPKAPAGKAPEGIINKIKAPFQHLMAPGGENADDYGSSSKFYQNIEERENYYKQKGLQDPREVKKYKEEMKRYEAEKARRKGSSIYTTFNKIASRRTSRLKKISALNSAGGRIL
jgi:hypothetical protein